jgi:hypothetical protein
MCLSNRPLTPEAQKEIARLLPLADFYDCSRIEGLVGVIGIVVVEEVLLPVIGTVCSL